MTENQKKLRAKKATRHFPGRSQKGQILIIVVFAIMGLVAFVGLVVDTGLVFIGNGKLRRAVDSAALAAASQYRKDPNPYGLNADAFNFLKANGVEDPNATVKVCNAGYPDFNDPTLCTSPANRRLVRVDASSTVSLAFLPVIGIRTVTLHATATSEAASLDIVLNMDVSESMTFDAPQADLMMDPVECNNVGSVDALSACQPFHDIQQAAINFVEDLFPADGSNQYDRVAIIPFDNNAHYLATGNYNDPLHLGDSASYSSIDYRAEIIRKLSELRVYTASSSMDSGTPYTSGSCLDPNGNLNYPAHATCRYYPPNTDETCFEQPVNTNPPHWLGYSLPDGTPGKEDVFNDHTCFTPTPPDSPHIGAFIRPSDGAHFERAYDYMVCPKPEDNPYCGTTNTGGAFEAAGQEFVRDPGFRQESLWVVIMLTDGVANHSNGDIYCPVSDGSNCQDTSVRTAAAGSRHCLPENDPLYSINSFLYSSCISGGGVVDASMYDADDYARDMADYDALGQSALIYTIGFGDALHHGDPLSPGEQLLNYAADIGDDAKIDTPVTALNSDYFFAHDATALGTIFKTISDRIATRLTQ